MLNLKNKVKKITKANIREATTYIATEKFKNIKIGLDESEVDLFKSYLDLNDPNSVAVLNDLRGK